MFEPTTQLGLLDGRRLGAGIGDPSGELGVGKCLRTAPRRISMFLHDG
jgi:hypothetical protein